MEKKKENSGNEYARQPFSEFKEDYEGFDWEKGEIVFIQKSNGANFLIWSANSPWKVIAEKHFDKPVVSWKHTENVMAITLDF